MANQPLRDRTVGGGAAQFLPALNPFLGLLPREFWPKTKDFFVYSIEFVPLAASATSTTSIQIQADSAFLITMGTVVVTDTTNATFISNIPELILITDAGSGRQLSDKAVHMNNLFGTAQLPAVWPFPKIMAPSSTLAATLQNLEATARNVRLSFWGFKVFGFTGSAT